MAENENPPEGGAAKANANKPPPAEPKANAPKGKPAEPAEPKTDAAKPAEAKAAKAERTERTEPAEAKAKKAKPAPMEADGAQPEGKAAVDMETLVALCKRRGFIFQSSEIYGGYSGFFDYGPLGVELKNNIRAAWWADMVHAREDIVGLDSSIIANPKTWEASGHTENFADPMVECSETGERYRADHLPMALLGVLSREESGEVFEPLAFSCTHFSDDLEVIRRHFKGQREAVRAFYEMSPEEASRIGALKEPPAYFNYEFFLGDMEKINTILKDLEVFEKHRDPNLNVAIVAKMGNLIRSPNFEPLYDAYRARWKDDEFEETLKRIRKIPIIAPHAKEEPNTLSYPSSFRLMFPTQVGASDGRDGEASDAYLRPETAQGIFTNFKNVLDSTRLKLPFGIAQAGKAFRNEIAPRNFVFRAREFEQLELEYFIAPDADWKTIHREWVRARKDWLISIGIPGESLHEEVHAEDKLAHYAQACTDLMFDFPHGRDELEGIAARGDHDLKAHQKASGKSLEIFDEASGKKLLPHVIEPSLGLDRTVLAILTAAYREDELPDEKGKVQKRSYLKLHPRIAPYKAAVLPLVKNKPELRAAARKLYEQLKARWNIFWDETGSIGKRYRRQDEIGTPLCITVDFDTLEKDGQPVTVRFRDTAKQKNRPLAEVEAFLAQQLKA